MSRFGELLKQYRLRSRRSEDGRHLTQEQFSVLIDHHDPPKFNASTVSRWETGARRIRSDDRRTLLKIVNVLVDYQGIQSVAEADNLLQAGGYSQLSVGEIEEVKLTYDDVDDAPLNSIDNSLSSPPDWNPLHWAKEWFSHTLRLDEATDHVRSSNEGMALYIFSQIVDSISASGFLKFGTAIALWIAAGWLLTPIWQWPLADEGERLMACVRYAIATLGLPLIIASVTPQEEHTRLNPTTWREYGLLITLKTTGAWLGFCLFATVPFVLVLIYLYITQAALPTWVTYGLAWLPVFFGYLTTRRHIVNHYAWTDHEWRFWLEADLLILAIPVFLGGGVAGIVYISHDFLVNPMVGFALLIVLLGLVFWHGRDSVASHLLDWQIILIVGVILPLIAFGIIIFASDELGDFFAFTLEENLMLLLVLAYVLTYISLWATLIVRKTARVSLRGIIVFAIIMYAIAWLTDWNLTVARSTLIILILVWVWQRRRIEPWLYFHPSYYLIHVVIAGSLIGYERMWFPLWLNLVLFVVVSTGLITWAYRAHKRFSPVIIT